MSHHTVKITPAQADATQQGVLGKPETPTEEYIRQRSDLPRAPSPTLPPYDNMMLSPGELSLMFEDREFPQQTVDAFPDEPAVAMTLRSYAFIALTIRSLERSLE